MDDDDVYNDDFRIPSPKGKRKAYDVEHESLSVDEIEEAIQKEADHVVGIFGVDVCTCVQFLFLYDLTAVIAKHSDASLAVHELEQRTPHREIHG